MRKFLLFMALVFSFPAFAQAQLPATANLTASDSGACTTVTNACLAVNINGTTGSAVVSIGGTFSASAVIEGNSGGLRYLGRGGVCSNLWRFSSYAARYIENEMPRHGFGFDRIKGARIHLFTSGTVAAGISTSTASASLGAGGGGGGGGVTLVTADAPLSVTNGSSTPDVSLTVGTGCSPGSFSTGDRFSVELKLQRSSDKRRRRYASYVGPTAVNGCGVEWTGLLTFTVGQCTYIINGITYNSAITNLTLAAADVTNPRIDNIVVDNSGTARACRPELRQRVRLHLLSIRARHSLLTFVTVAANATTPTGITSETISMTKTWNGLPQRAAQAPRM